MRIGVDFDNTIVCFDNLFHRAAREKNLIPETVGFSKNDVRDYLRGVGKEDQWTTLQGDVYGDLIRDADPFPGVIDFFSCCIRRRIPIHIISHKTKQPFLGSNHDLHKAALDWLDSHGFFSQVGLDRSDVYLELTKEKKMDRIAALQCTHFVDDLPEFLLESKFPKNVRRFLFDPKGKEKIDPVLTPFSSWNEIRSLIETEDASHLTLRPLKGGANNLTFKVEGSECPTILKAYFKHPQDSRNRLQSEFGFISFAHKVGISAVPKPIAMDAVNNWGLYEFVEGHLVTPPELTSQMIDQAAGFFENLNRNKEDAAAATLPLASEACFSIQQHLDLVAERVARLDSLDWASDIELKNILKKVQAQVILSARYYSLDINLELSKSECCLSPSDFGFHNALLESNDELRFIDFEYAGWDDPAKTIVDFFCQPKVSVPMSFYPAFSKRLAICCASPEKTLKRTEILFPIYRIKWACILLNEFLPVGRERRRFAQDAGLGENRKKIQLDKVKVLLGGIS